MRNQIALALFGIIISVSAHAAGAKAYLINQPGNVVTKQMTAIGEKERDRTPTLQRNVTVLSATGGRVTTTAKKLPSGSTLFTRVKTGPGGNVLSTQQKTLP